VKSSTAVFQRTNATGVPAPAHTAYFTPPDGTPNLGVPAALGAPLAVPSGER
jgi:hypothetical protein